MSAVGQFLPRHLTDRAAAHKAAAPTVRYRGGSAPGATPQGAAAALRRRSREGGTTDYRPGTAVGQLDCSVRIAVPMSASEITPWIERRFSAIDIESSGTDCQASSTSADAFSGRSTEVPGITTLAVNSVVVAPATTVTLGCVCSDRGRTRTTRTCVVAPSPQRSIRPAKSRSDSVIFAVFAIAIDSGPPAGFGVRISRQVPGSDGGG
jgi:hypothetical protein